MKRSKIFSLVFLSLVAVSSPVFAGNWQVTKVNLKDPSGHWNTCRFSGPTNQRYTCWTDWFKTPPNSALAYDRAFVSFVPRGDGDCWTSQQNGHRDRTGGYEGITSLGGCTFKINYSSGGNPIHN